jgi:hypothetical protein
VGTTAHPLLHARFLCCPALVVCYSREVHPCHLLRHCLVVLVALACGGGCVVVDAMAMVMVIGGDVAAFRTLRFRDF